jgi:hypothetical protein
MQLLRRGSPSIFPTAELARQAIRISKAADRMTGTTAGSAESSDSAHRFHTPPSVAIAREMHIGRVFRGDISVMYAR